MRPRGDLRERVSSIALAVFFLFGFFFFLTSLSAIAMFAEEGDQMNVGGTALGGLLDD